MSPASPSFGMYSSWSAGFVPFFELVVHRLLYEPLALAKGGDNRRVFVELALRLQSAERLLHAVHSALKCGVRIEHQSIPESLERFAALNRGLPTNHDVDQ